MELAVDRVEVTGEADADRAADACNVEFGVAVEDAALVGGGGHRKLLRFHIRRLIRFISDLLQERGQRREPEACRLVKKGLARACAGPRDRRDRLGGTRRGW